MSKYSTRVAVYLLFEKNGKFLLGKRQNTGYKDGYWAFVQGHVEEGETATHAAIREAQEEVGVTPEIEFALVCLNQVDIHYTDYVFSCEKWQGEIENLEQEKCSELKWFAYDEIPEHSVFQVKNYINAYLNRVKFLEITEN
ncbi:MAG: NUDIX domain-containing protein [Alphaproteobacteria bacterium]|nr:NUDIX domain-containing protein [Alphaproteobacteria bacterium]